MANHGKRSLASRQRRAAALLVSDRLIMPQLQPVLGNNLPSPVKPNTIPPHIGFSAREADSGRLGSGCSRVSARIRE
jgi:hypothetical protein